MVGLHERGLHFDETEHAIFWTRLHATAAADATIHIDVWMQRRRHFDAFTLILFELDLMPAILPSLLPILPCYDKHCDGADDEQFKHAMTFLK
jgi:hypothetical protein